jgi:acyl carrier protein
MDSRLSEDLDFDSLQRLEILMLLEDTGGHEVPEHVQRRLETIQDVYEVYALYCGHSRS